MARQERARSAVSYSFGPSTVQAYIHVLESPIATVHYLHVKRLV